MFSVALPETFNVAYEITVSDEELEILEVDAPEKIVMLLVLSRPDDEVNENAAGKTSKGGRTNLHRPLLLNVDKRLVLQK